MRYLVDFLLFCIALFLFSASGTNATDRQQQDFGVFKSVLLQKEGRLDLHADSLAILAAIDQLEDSFKTERSLLEQFKLYGKTLSTLECGHTQMHPNREVFREWLGDRNSLPIDMYLIGKRLVVNGLTAADEPYINENKSVYERSKSIPAGSEILRIDGKTVHEMMLEIAPYLSSDENGLDFKYFQAEQLFDFFRHMCSPFTKDSIQVQYIALKDTHEIYMQPGTAPVIAMNTRLKNSALKFKQQEESMGDFKVIQGHGYFRFHSFKMGYGKKYNAFLKASFRTIANKNIDKIIVDLRGNTGGAMQYAFMGYILGKDAKLGRYVIEKPRKHGESRYLKKFNPDYIKHKRGSKGQLRLERKGKFNNGEILTKKVDTSLIYTGDIIVITDEGTFSSAAILAGHLKTLANAKIIGRTAGGSFYAGNAGTLILELPNSKLHMFVNPNTFYSQLAPIENPQLIKQPDRVLSPLIMSKSKLNQYYFNEAKKLFN